MIAAGVIAGWAGGLLILIAAVFIALGLMAWVHGEMTDEDRPFKDEDDH